MHKFPLLQLPQPPLLSQLRLKSTVKQSASSTSSMKTIRHYSSLAALKTQRFVWSKVFRRFQRNKRSQFRLFALVITIYLVFGRRRTHPTMYLAPPEQLVIPSENQNVVEFAHEHAREHSLPVYMFYKARSGQLNNQLISFFNALAIAKHANATLVAPYAFHGAESYVDFGTGRSIFFHMRQALDMYIHQSFLKALGLYYKHDELVGDYFDGTLLNKSQPVISVDAFRRSAGGDYLRTFQHVLTRRGDAPFFYMTLGKRYLFERNVNVRGETVDKDPDVRESPPSRKELDCNFNVSDHFRGLSYSAGVNGNFLFLSKLYRSHSLNCTAKDSYWLNLRKYVQPIAEIRQLVDSAMKRWGKVMTIHLRLFPFDNDKFSTSGFCNFFYSHVQHSLQEVDHVYIAYSISSKDSVAVVSQLRQRLGQKKIITAEDYGDLYAMGPMFNKRYAVPIVDMWTCVKSHFFLGRLGSSLSWNVVYWRQSFKKEVAGHHHDFYTLQDFSSKGEKNPLDSYGF